MATADATIPSGAESDSIELRPGEEILTGVLERILFFNAENHYCVGELQPADRADRVVVAGLLPGINCGETLRLAGLWSRHPTHGDQFRVRAFRSTLPATVYGIRKYLASGLVPGIGKVYANKIVDRFGAETLLVIDHDSGRLREVPGIGAKRAREIKKAWDEQKTLREVLMFMQTYGVTVGQCLRLVKHYGDAATQILRQNPFAAAREIEGIGFKTADRIARNLGFANDSLERLEAGLVYLLHEAEDEGHTGLPPDALQTAAATLLEADTTRVGDCLQTLLEARQIVLPSGGDLLQLPATLTAEERIASALARLAAVPSCLPPIKIEAAVAWAEARAGFTFAPAQSEAVAACLSEKVSIITGGPGTGKTTILRALVDILKAKKVRILLASPTGRAAQRMTEATGAPAQTIHRLLRYDPATGSFTANDQHPLHCDYLIVDESSMLDTRLAASLLRAVPSSAGLVLVGDMHQLPSVGPGMVLGDLIESGLFRVTSLRHIFRQQADSGIIATAHAILNGQAAPPHPVDSLAAIDPQSDLHFVKAVTPEECLRTVITLCRDWMPARGGLDPVSEAQVIVPMHRGTAGIANFNKELQAALNPRQIAISLGSQLFHEGDKVIQTRNNYEKGIFNGEMGRVTALNPAAGTLAADFDGEVHDFERHELGDLQPAYAISVHKSQGSEFPAVVVPLLKQHFMMLQRNLLYTAVTRGRRRVFIVGDPAAYSMAVRNAESTRRQTDLQRKLRQSLSPHS